jgi:hypothetical protein
VVNSRWIADQERINSVHPYHRGGWHERLNHYVFCFHDETFECIAEGFSTVRGGASVRVGRSLRPGLSVQVTDPGVLVGPRSPHVLGPGSGPSVVAVGLYSLVQRGDQINHRDGSRLGAPAQRRRP